MKYFLGQFFLRAFYYPLLFCLKIIFALVPAVKERRDFENKNKDDLGAQSFKSVNIKADLCFEFSSEGEFQQVASLIADSLKAGKTIELVFFSKSVEKTITDLFNMFPKQIRYLRYPLLSLKFSRWITSDTLIMVRYDLFPEFFVWSLKAPRVLKFVWVSFKKERVKNKAVSFYKRFYLRRAQSIIFASVPDQELGVKLGLSGHAYDFRMEQINRRMINRLKKFETQFVLYPALKAIIEMYPRQKRLIMGNAWPLDLFLLKDLPADVKVLIVPHQLTPEIIEAFVSRIDGLSFKSAIIDDNSTSIPDAQILILNKKGILCELYSDFGKAYVGGGFGVSVHSLLEPLVAGSQHLSCGPVHHRSTEFDLAQSYGQIKEVNNSQDFNAWLAEDIPELPVHDKLQSQVNAYAVFMKDIVS